MTALCCCHVTVCVYSYFKKFHSLPLPLSHTTLFIPSIYPLPSTLPTRLSHEFLSGQITELTGKVKALEKKAKKAPDEVKSQLKAFLTVQSQYAHTTHKLYIQAPSYSLMLSCGSGSHIFRRGQPICYVPDLFPNMYMWEDT